jgi:chaperone modulatory protein CbpM
MSDALRAIAAEHGLAADELTVWIERRWLRPEHAGAKLELNQADRARIAMILEFRRDMAIDDEAMPVVLDLLDRLHAARAYIRSMIEALAGLPASERNAMLSRFGDASVDDGKARHDHIV